MMKKMSNSHDLEDTFDELEKKGYTFEHVYNYMTGHDYCLTQVFDANSKWVCSFVWRDRTEKEYQVEYHVGNEHPSKQVIVFDAFNGPIGPDGTEGMN